MYYFKTNVFSEDFPVSSWVSTVLGSQEGAVLSFFFLPRLELRSSIDRDSLASHCVLISGLPKDGRQTN